MNIPRKLDPVVEYRVYPIWMMAKTKSSPTQSLTIGKLAKLAGVGIETIRFYEREGVIPAPPRRESGYREYDSEMVTRLHFIKRAQDLGFSLKQITELLALRIKSGQNCSAVKTKAEAKLAEIENKIRDLRRMQKVLTEVTAACVASKPISDCPILKCFEQ